MPSSAAYVAVATSDVATYAVAALAALAGAYTFWTCGKPVLNMALGVLGALLVAQGTVTILLAGALSPEAVAAMQLDAYSTYYVFATAVLLYTLRSVAVCCREGCDCGGTPQPAAAVRSPAKAPVPPKRPGGKVAPASAAKRPGGKKSMV